MTSSMDSAVSARKASLRPYEAEPVRVHAPATQRVPFVFASPHSGAFYHPSFLAASRLDPVTLRRSEDSFIDEIFAAAPALGAPLLLALFPRAYLDPNREPYELDAQMFAEPLPPFVKTRSERVRAGFGTIARMVSTGAEIYRERLRFAEAEARVRTLYEPYHNTLDSLVEATHAKFGAAIVIDCHSMPSIGGPSDKDAGRLRTDIVLGDRYGTSCAPALIDAAERTLKGLGFRVARNDPYAGAHTLIRHGRPDEGVHALQIEINRALYLDEGKIAKLAGFADLVRRITSFLEAMSWFDASDL